MFKSSSPSRRLGRSLLTLVTATLLVACGANAGAPKEPTVEQVKKAAMTKLPKAKINSVRETPIKGLYEIVVNGNAIFYIDAKADYLIQGELIQIAGKKNLTAATFQEMRKDAFNTIPLDLAIKEVKGDGSRKLVVFSDPDCPFCHQLEKNALKDMTNITVYTLLYPLPIHPDAARKSALIWCAPDRTKAWRDWMDQGKLPENDGKCDTPIAQIQKLGEQWGVEGTPAIVLQNGNMLPGAYPREQIEAAMAAK